MGNFLSAVPLKNLSKLPIICSSCEKNYLLRFKNQRYIILVIIACQKICQCNQYSLERKVVRVCFNSSCLLQKLALFKFNIPGGLQLVQFPSPIAVKVYKQRARIYCRFKICREDLVFIIQEKRETKTAFYVQQFVNMYAAIVAFQ